MKSILLVIDLQKQFKDKYGQYEKCIEYITSQYNNTYVLGTMFKNTGNSMYEKHLNWSDCKEICANDIEYPYHELLVKTGYGFDKLNKETKYQIVGCDADACVLATAFNLWDRGIDFEVLSDYIYTTAEDFDKETIIKIMRRNFGNCIKSKNQ